MSELGDAFKRLIKRQLPEINIFCEVTSVDAEKMTVDVQPVNGSPEIFDVRLTASAEQQSNFMVVYPKVGTTVLVSFFDQSHADGYVSAVDEPERVVIKIGDYKLEIDSNGIKLNDGQIGGLPKSNSVLAKLNQLESQVNQLKSILAAWIPVPTDGGAALKVAVTAWAASQITPTQISDIENQKVKQ